MCYYFFPGFHRTQLAKQSSISQALDSLCSSSISQFLVKVQPGLLMPIHEHAALKSRRIPFLLLFILVGSSVASTSGTP